MLLCGLGFLLFFSVSLGTLETTSGFLRTIIKQVIALGLGLSLMIFIAYSKQFDYRKLKYASLAIFVAVIVLELLVFLPGIGLEIKGARRWIDLGVASIQPSEFLKLGVVIFLSALCAEYGKKLSKLKPLFFAILLTLGVVFVILFLAKDIGTFLVISIACFGILFISKASNLHLFGLAGLGATTLLGAVYFFRPYAWGRLTSFFNITEDALGSDFQIDQSLWTIGSGEIFGRGFGQSLQKFSYLPEPLGDSIFAVTAEEWGFFGSVILILLFLFFVIRGFNIAKRSKDVFGQYLVTGLILLIGAQSFINIAAMLKLFPLSGMPLIFVSQGGTALLGALISVGIILNVSRFAKKKI